MVHFLPVFACLGDYQCILIPICIYHVFTIFSILDFSSKGVVEDVCMEWRPRLLLSVVLFYAQIRKKGQKVEQREDWISMIAQT